MVDVKAEYRLQPLRLRPRTLAGQRPCRIAGTPQVSDQSGRQNRFEYRIPLTVVLLDVAF